MARIVLLPAPSTHGDFLNNCNSMFTEVYADILANTSKLSTIEDDADVSSGLERVTGSGGFTGLVIKNRVTANYGLVGMYAVDLSSSDIPSSVYGATGSYSFASGLRTIASGTHSFACGGVTIASGVDSFASGAYTEANGNYSAAFGNTSIANGDYSFACGYQTEAAGDYSFTQGAGTRAYGVGSVGMGAYNVGLMSTMLEVGMGTGDELRVNSFEVHLDGRIVAPELTIALINSVGDTSLVTKEYADSLTGGGSATVFEGEFNSFSLSPEHEVFFTHGLSRRPASPPAVYDHNDNLVSPSIICTETTITLSFGGTIDGGSEMWKILAI